MDCGKRGVGREEERGMEFVRETAREKGGVGNLGARPREGEGRRGRLSAV